jgi:hypothetical protein
MAKHGAECSTHTAAQVAEMCMRPRMQHKVQQCHAVQMKTDVPEGYHVAENKNRIKIFFTGESHKVAHSKRHEKISGLC